MILPLYGIIAIAAGGGTLLLAGLIITIVILHRKRKNRSRATLDNLHMSLGTGENVDLDQVRAYSPSKSRIGSWTSNSARRNKLQRSPTHARTLRQASSRDSIKPLLTRHRKPRDGFFKPSVSIVDSADLEVIEPAPVYVPTGRPAANVPLTPISEKDTPESDRKTNSYRGVIGSSQGFGWNFGTRPLPVPKGHKRRSLSESATDVNHPNDPQMPKSILKKPAFHRSISLSNQSPGPAPDLELPPTPKISHAMLPKPQGLFLPVDKYYHNFPAGYSSSPPEPVLPNQHAFGFAAPNTPTPTPFLRTIGRNITPPEYEQFEIDQLRGMDNSPAHSTKSSIRPPLRTHNSYQASLERTSLVRDKSSSLSLSLQDNWVTPSKPTVIDVQDESDGQSEERLHENWRPASPLAMLNPPRRQVLQESTGNSTKQTTLNSRSQSLHTGKHPRKTALQEDRRPGASAPRSESHKRSSTHRIVVQPSRPNSMARSAVISEDEAFEFDPSVHGHAQTPSQVTFTPVMSSTLPPDLRPPSVAEFNPAIDHVPALYGLRDEIENDPEFQNPNPEYSPLMSICRDMMSDSDSANEDTSNPNPDRKSMHISPLEPRKRMTMILPPPTRETPLSSSPPESPLKIDEAAFPRPSTSRTTSNTNTHTSLRANTSSLRKHPGRRGRKQDHSPLRQAFRPSDSPEPPPRNISRESLMKQNARMTTTIMALRRQNSDASTRDASYFRLSGSSAGTGLFGGGSGSGIGINDGGIGLDMLNKGFADPFTDTTARWSPLGKKGASTAPIASVMTPPAKFEPVRERRESERGLSPTAKRIMAEERRDQYERRRSRDSLNGGDFGAIGEERKMKKVRQSRGKQMDELLVENAAGLSPGALLTAAGAF